MMAVRKKKLQRQ